MMSPRTKRASGALLNLGLRGLGVALVLGGLAIPAYAFYYATRPPVYGLSGQVTIPLPREHPEVAVPPYDDGVLVLSYHDLSARPHNEYTVTPSTFAAQMAALRGAGFQTIGAAEFTRFHEGRGVALPSRPLLITFDDGAKGTWIYADRVLRRLHFEATVFLITADVSHHQPYYLSWAEVEEMHASGRWSFGSHTADGHGLVASDNSGGKGPFLTNRIWMQDQNRLETLGEYEARVRGDLDDSIADIESHGLPTPEVFAFPFSATVEPTNDPAIGPILARMLARRFSAQFDNTSTATLIRQHQRGPLPRVEVFRTTTAAGLLREAAEAIRRSPAASSEGGT